MPYKSRGIRGQWSDVTMKQAVKAVLVNGKSNKKACKEYGVPLETLRRKVIIARNGGGVDKHMGRPTVLNEEAENELAKILMDMEARLYGLSPGDVRQIVYKYCEKNGITNNFSRETAMAGRYWLDGFLSRHPELSIRHAEAVSIQRAIGFNKPKVDMFYSMLKRLLFTDKGGIAVPPGNIYNVDESGYTVCQKPNKIIARKGKHNVGQLTSAEKGKTVTAVCCMSAIGMFVPPLLIFPRARMKPVLMDNAPVGAVGVPNKSGWISEAIFTQWFQHFIDTVQPQSRPQPVLLLMDGHKSHTANLDVVELATKNNVVLLVLPSHCTHRLQPLDISFFKSLNTNYDAEVVSWLRNHPGRSVTEEQIGQIFASAYGKSANINNATKGFAKAGIHPFRDDLFTDEDFAGNGI
jgi:transposase-like protein